MEGKQEKEGSGEVAMGTGEGQVGKGPWARASEEEYRPLPSRAEQGLPCVCVSV